MISIIAAVADNGIIGNANRMPWHLKEDLRHFKALTLGHGVVMGRKTWQSLGRPLPDRRNVVVTRQELEAPGCEVVHSLHQAIALFSPEEELFVIGGAQLYALALPLADRLYLTRIHCAYEGDTRFPEWSETAWRLVACDVRATDPDFAWTYEFQTWERKK